MKPTFQPQGMSASALSLKCDLVALQMALAEVVVIRGPSFRSQGRNRLLEEVPSLTTEP